MEDIFIGFLMSIMCWGVLAVFNKIIKRPMQSNYKKENVNKNLYSDVNIEDICAKLEQQGRTQFDFLSTLAMNVAKQNNPTMDNMQALQAFVTPCIEQAVNTKYPNLSQDKQQSIQLAFVHALTTNLKEKEHKEILRLVVEYLLSLEVMANKAHIKIDETNVKRMISIGTAAMELSKDIAEYYVSNISYVREIIEAFGTEQDLQNFDTWVAKHEETGKWDWKFFSQTNLGEIFWLGNEKFKNIIKDNETQFRLKQIRQAQKQIAQKNNPIDKTIKKVWQTLLYSKFIKYMFWICISILIVTLMILAD